MISLTDQQARDLTTTHGYEIISSLVRKLSVQGIQETMQLTSIENICDPAVAAGAFLYFEEQIDQPLQSILNKATYEAYELLTRNHRVETEAAKTTLAQRLSVRPSHIKLLTAFSLFGGLLNMVADEMEQDSILTPAALMLVRESTPNDSLVIFELFQKYIDDENEFSYGPILGFIPRMFNASDLKFSHIYSERALPVFVQMMRIIPNTELALLEARFAAWLTSTVPNGDYSAFIAVAASMLQIFYRQIVIKAIWPK